MSDILHSVMMVIVDYDKASNKKKMSQNNGLCLKNLSSIRFIKLTKALFQETHLATKNYIPL